MEQIRKKQRVAVYCRFSTDSEEQPASREAQETRYTQKISENPDWEMVGFYADKGIIGADRKNHTEFDKMVAACKRGDIDIILVRSISRFVRRTAECLEMVRMLKAIGVSVIFEKEGIDTSTESGELCVTLFSEFVRRESESITANFIYPV